MTIGDPFSPPLIIHIVKAASLSAGSIPSGRTREIINFWQMLQKLSNCGNFYSHPLEGGLRGRQLVSLNKVWSSLVSYIHYVYGPVT